MQAPRIAIVLVNWNGREDTLRCLRSLTSLDDMDVRVIICDNGSTDESIPAFLEWGRQSLGGVRKGVLLVGRGEIGDVTLGNFLTIIDNGTNLGFAGANNVGIRLALAESSIDAVWLLNNDTEVEPGTLAALRRRFAEDPSIGICGSTLIYWYDRTKVQAVGVRFNLALGRGHMIGLGQTPERLPDRNKVERSMTYVPGASMYVSRRFLETVGLLEESYFLYFEELDWSLRNRGRFNLAWVPESVVYHKEGGSIGTLAMGRQSDLAMYYHNVNLLRVVARFRPYLLPLSFLRLSLVAARFLLKRDQAAARVVLRAGADFVVGRRRLGGAWLSNRAPIARAPKEECYHMSETTIAIIDPLGKHGGLHYYIDGVARGLSKTGRRVLVYVTTFTGVTGCEPYEAFASFGQLYGSDLVLLRGWRYLSGLIASTGSAKWRGAKAVSHHLFHYGLKEVAAVWLARILGMKVILTLHDVESFGQPWSRLLRSLILAGTSGFIVHNRFSMAHFERLAEAIDKPRTIIPHGHYADYFPQPQRTEARALLGLPNDPMIFLFFGNSRQEKGLDLLFEACAGMKERQGWMLLVAGKMKPDQLGHYRSLINRHGLAAFVRVDAKHVSDKEVLAYYGAADLVVVPYRRVYESGVTIMAMSLGRAVLVSNLEPLVESIAGGEAGLVFESDNAKALIARLMQAMEERSSLDSIGARAYTHVIAARDWEEIGEKTGLFVDKVCGWRR